MNRNREITQKILERARATRETRRRRAREGPRKPPTEYVNFSTEEVPFEEPEEGQVAPETGLRLGPRKEWTVASVDAALKKKFVYYGKHPIYGTSIFVHRVDPTYGVIIEVPMRQTIGHVVLEKGIPSPRPLKPYFDSINRRRAETLRLKRPGAEEERQRQFNAIASMWDEVPDYMQESFENESKETRRKFKDVLGQLKALPRPKFTDFSTKRQEERYIDELSKKIASRALSKHTYPEIREREEIERASKRIVERAIGKLFEVVGPSTQYTRDPTLRVPTRASSGLYFSPKPQEKHLVIPPRFKESEAYIEIKRKYPNITDERAYRMARIFYDNKELEPPLKIHNFEIPEEDVPAYEESLKLLDKMMKEPKGKSPVLIMQPAKPVAETKRLVIKEPQTNRPWFHEKMATHPKKGYITYGTRKCESLSKDELFTILSKYGSFDKTKLTKAEICARLKKLYEKKPKE